MSLKISGGVFAGRPLLGPPRRASSSRSPRAAVRNPRDGSKYGTSRSGAVSTHSAGGGVRPTAVRLRRSLFDVLGDELQGAEVLDVCAGVGTLGLEAMSRGARRCVFVERSRHLSRRIWSNVSRLGALDAEVIAADARRVLKRRRGLGRRFGVAFLDPPWDAWTTRAGPELLLTVARLKPRWIAAEHPAGFLPPPEIGGPVGRRVGRMGPRYFRTRILRAGSGAFSLYRLSRADRTRRDPNLRIPTTPPTSSH